MRLIFTDPAARDLDDIIDYIAADDPAAAEGVYRSIVAATGRLKDFPDIGHVGRLPGTRELSISSLPYIVAYQRDAQAVTILAIFHAARDIRSTIRDRRKILRQ
jgi:toxin ParE1/3/4